jgi:hypothetical protein
MKLLKLPNGSWVDPRTITSIRPLPTSTGFTGHLHRARVVVNHGAGLAEEILANDDADALRIADEIAGQTEP